MKEVINISVNDNKLKKESSKLPKVLCSTVIRYAQKGESHGKMYLVDLDTGRYQEVFDWHDDSISWKERGYDRGLRGIALKNGKIYVASFENILVFNESFSLIETIKGRYLNACHDGRFNGHS